MSDLYHGPSLRNEMVKWLDSENDYSIVYTNSIILVLLFEALQANGCVEFIKTLPKTYPNGTLSGGTGSKNESLRNTTNIYIYN